MTQPRSTSRLSYGRAALVLLGGLLLGWLVLAVTIDRVLAGTAPATALVWNPASADANTRIGDQSLQDGQTSSDLAAVSPTLSDHALRALRRQPVDAEAARQLGVAAAATGQDVRGRRLFAYAEAMSRRDLQTQLVLIETSVAHKTARVSAATSNRLKNNVI